MFVLHFLFLPFFFILSYKRGIWRFQLVNYPPSDRMAKFYQTLQKENSSVSAKLNFKKL